MAIDQHDSVILVLLDLSAAFDTVLLSRLSNRFGITGTVLEWFRSYLSDRTQFVQVNGACSASHVLEFGVPQGFVFGPLLYSLYTSPLGEIADIIKCSITLMLMTPSYILRSGRRLFLI